MKQYETLKVVPVDVQFEAALLTASIHTDEASVTIQDYLIVGTDDGVYDYFEPDFK